MEINKNIFRQLNKCKKYIFLEQNKLGYKIENEAFDNSKNLDTIKFYASSFFEDCTDAKTQTHSKIEAFELTKKLLSYDLAIIKNPTFVYENLSYSCAYLTKDDDTITFYEIKCATKCKQTVIVDFCFLKYILTKLNISNAKFAIINVNANFVKTKNFSVRDMLKINDVTERVENSFLETKFDCLDWSIDSSCLDIALHKECCSPYPCPYFAYCSNNLTSPNVFDLYDVNFEDKLQLYFENKISFDDLKYIHKNKIQQLQVQTTLDNSVHIEQDNLKKFIDTIKYPIYYLDFETTQSIIQIFEGTKPFEQIPFMFSLHYQKSPKSKLKHKCYIGNGNNPSFIIALLLCLFISSKGSVIVFGDSLEKSVINNLAKRYNIFSKKLTKIHNNIIDLSYPFQEGYYYSPQMSNSLSLKSIVPAMFTNEKELDYNTNSDVHNGNQAMLLYPQFANMTKARKKLAKQELSKYCSLDTYSMVRILAKLKNEC